MRFRLGPYAVPAFVMAMNCGAEIDDGSSSDRFETTIRAAIIDDQDWDNVMTHTPSADPAYHSDRSGWVFERKSGLAKLTTAASVCTAFLVSSDIIATAFHCIYGPNAYPTANGTPYIATFGLFKDPATGQVPSGSQFTCNQIWDLDPETDTVLLKCSTKPGQAFDALVISDTPCVPGNDMISLSVNRRTGELGSQYVLMAPGGLDQTSARFDKCEVEDISVNYSFTGYPQMLGITHNCDNLPGSSGGPLLRKYTGMVYGIASSENSSHNTHGSIVNYVQYYAELPNLRNGVPDPLEIGNQILWAHTSGLARLWRVDSTDHWVSSTDIGTLADWTPKAYSRRNMAHAKLMWAQNVAGAWTARIWRLNSVDAQMNLGAWESSHPSSVDIGPFTGWEPMDYEQLAVDEGAGAKLLWWNASTGIANLWTLDGLDHFVSVKSYGPYSGWTAQGYTQEYDGAGGTHVRKMLWSRNDGYASLWTLDSSDNWVSSRNYGPYAGWQAVDYEKIWDGTARMLWFRASDGLTEVWQLDNSDNFVTSHNEGPYVGWTPRSFSEL